MIQSAFGNESKASQKHSLKIIESGRQLIDEAMFYALQLKSVKHMRLTHLTMKTRIRANEHCIRTI